MKRRKFTAKFKAKVVLESLRERISVQGLARKHELHPNQISKWKAEFLDNADSVFDKGSTKESEEPEDVEKLYKVIGQQKVEIDRPATRFLKKALS